MYFVTLKKWNKCGAEIVVFWKDQRLRNMPSLNLLVKMIMYLHYRQQQNQDYLNDFIFYNKKIKTIWMILYFIHHQGDPYVSVRFPFWKESQVLCFNEMTIKTLQKFSVKITSPNVNV